MSDLSKAGSIDEFVAILFEHAATTANDAANLDACGQNGTPWQIISDELNRAVERMQRRIKTSGYPLDV